MSAGGTAAPKKAKNGAFATFCIYFFCVWVGYYALIGFFGGVKQSGGEPFDPRKMSQVPKVWPRPAWAAPQEQNAWAVPTERPRRQVQVYLPSWDEAARNGGFKFYDEWCAERD